MYGEERRIEKSLRAIEHLVDNKSWFRDSPHYWAEASLPLAYAVACVEVVCKCSEKAQTLYKKIVEAWSDTGVKAMGDEIASIKPDVVQDDSCVLTTGQTSA